MFSVRAPFFNLISWFYCISWIQFPSWFFPTLPPALTLLLFADAICVTCFPYCWGCICVDLSISLLLFDVCVFCSLYFNLLSLSCSDYFSHQFLCQSKRETVVGGEEASAALSYLFPNELEYLPNNQSEDLLLLPLIILCNMRHYFLQVPHVACCGELTCVCCTSPLHTALQRYARPLRCRSLLRSHRGKPKESWYRVPQTLR